MTHPFLIALLGLWTLISIIEIPFLADITGILKAFARQMKSAGI